MAGIGQMFAVLVVAIVLMLVSVPLVSQYGGANAAQNLTGIVNTQTSNITSHIYNPINVSTNNKTTTGFFAPITQFSGYAFVFGNIGNIIYALFQLPASLQTIVNNVLAPISPIIGGSGINTGLIVGLFETVGFTFILITGVSAWLKYNLWGG